MNKNQTEHINHPLTEECLHYECEQALLRRRYTEPSTDAAWKAFRSSLQQSAAMQSAPKRSFHHFRWIATVAAAAVALIAVWWTRYSSQAEPCDIRTLYTAVEEITPITVEEQLSDIEKPVVKEKATASTPTRQEQMTYAPCVLDYTRREVDKVRNNVISIPCGQICKVILPDGTEAWLNANSRLKFPTRFTGTKRIVKLEGEAFLKVARNEAMPFIIRTENFTTQVLGTEFNIKSYPGSEAHVTLVEGSVKVQMPKLGKEVLLTPGEDVACCDTAYQVKKVDTAYYTQWREGYFYFDDMHLTDILCDLGRWYNVTVEMEEDALLINQRLHFVAERSGNIDQVIQNLNAFSYLSVTRNENKLTVRRKK